jgi:hypothetical protein
MAAEKRPHRRNRIGSKLCFGAGPNAGPNIYASFFSFGGTATSRSYAL